MSYAKGCEDELSLYNPGIACAREVSRTMSDPGLSGEHVVRVLCLKQSGMPQDMWSWQGPKEIQVHTDSAKRSTTGGSVMGLVWLLTAVALKSVWASGDEAEREALDMRQVGKHLGMTVCSLARIGRVEALGSERTSATEPHLFWKLRLSESGSRDEFG